MPNKFKAIAQEVTVFSAVMEGREKVKCDDIIEAHPERVTITEFDIVTITDERTHEDKPVPVFAIEEDPGVCFFGGAVLAKIALAWADAYDGDIATASEELKKQGGVPVRLEKGKTKKGQDIVNVIVLDK